MMGPKARAFAPLPPVSLADCVPPDHRHRRLRRTLDSAFVRDLMRDAHRALGRPSIDPLGAFELQWVLTFEELRLLIQQAGPFARHASQAHLSTAAVHRRLTPGRPSVA